MPGRLMPTSNDVGDPFSLLLTPPPDETPQSRALREEKEHAAKQVSDAIDEALRLEKATERKQRPVKLLLLGQSESGKSTTLRQFQRLYTPTAFREERQLWRSIVQLNLARSIRIILDALGAVQNEQQAQLNDHDMSFSDDNEDNTLVGADRTPKSKNKSLHTSKSRERETSLIPDEDYIPISAELEMLKLRLEPLRHVESMLISKLAPPNEDEATRLHIGPQAGSLHPRGKSSSQHHTSHAVGQDQEVYVRSGYSWKGHMARVQSRSPGPVSASRPTSAGAMFAGMGPDEVTEMIHRSREDLMELWRDTAVREILRRRKLRLEEYPGFFLDQLNRVTAIDYTPSDDDVLRARLKTVGVSEYKFQLEASAGKDSGLEWRIYDVGGTRSQRATWVPFFDDVDAIIFLAPISAFDQTLAEDRSVNRLEDSVLLWKSICSNKLLARVDLILFLNKCDILSQKLRSGIKLSKYVRSYADRPNDMENASQYFRTKFASIQREYSPLPRRFYGYSTSVTDPITTSGILASVRDTIVREHLRQSRLI